MSAIRVLLRLDAGLETVLAVTCALLAYGLLGTDRWSLPPWLSAPLLTAAAAVLLVAAVALWWLAGRPGPGVVRAVAIANAVTTVAFVVWAIAGWGAGSQLRILAAMAAVLLGALATVQYARATRLLPKA
jgi:multisubunit Na+/H+ antiporter MnhF subunit